MDHPRQPAVARGQVVDHPAHLRKVGDIRAGHFDRAARLRRLGLKPQDSPQAARCGISRAVAGKVAFPFMAHREGRAAQQDHAGAGRVKNIRREGHADAPETAGDEVASL